MGHNSLLLAVIERLLKVTGPDTQGWYTSLCPSHDDHNPSLRLNKNGFKCMACGERGNLRNLVEKLGVPVAARGTEDHRHQDGQRLTLAQLSQAKGLPLELLRELGWRDTEHQGKSAVAIPYRDASGNLLREQLRLRLEKRGKRDGCFIWVPGDGISPLGLDRLQSVRDAGFVLVVEGGTDYAACVAAGIPALGIPRANTWRDEWRLYLDDIPLVLVWQESDAGGLALVKAIAASCPDLRVITAPPEAKDPCALRQLDPEGFPHRMSELMAGAFFRSESTAADRPAIQVNDRFMREISHDAILALEQANDPPKIFRRGLEILELLAAAVAPDEVTDSLLAWACELAEKELVLRQPVTFIESPLRPMSTVRVSHHALIHLRTIAMARTNQVTGGWGRFTREWWREQERAALWALAALRKAMEEQCYQDPQP